MTQYQPNIPQFFDFLNDSQPKIQRNFVEANRLFSVNHYPFDDANAGKHKHSVYVLRESSPVTEEDEIAVYNLNVEGERNNLRVRYQDSTEVFSFSPYMQCFIRLTDDTENPITLIGNSLNFDLDKSGWNRRTIILYFLFPTDNISYHVEITRGSNLPGSIPLQVKNKDTEFFEIDNAGFFAANNQLYVRVYV